MQRIKRDPNLNFSFLLKVKTSTQVFNKLKKKNQFLFFFVLALPHFGA